MKRGIIKAVIAIMAIVFCTITPFYNMIVKGVYRWHIAQPETWQGGIVVIAFIIVTFIFCGVVKSKKSFILFCGLAAVYLFINGVLIPFLIVFGYFEMLSYIGASVLSIRKAKLESNIVKRLIAGICVWGFFAIICSLLRFGTFNDLRLLTGVLFVIAIVISRRKKYFCLLFAVNQTYWNISKKRIALLSFTALSYVVMILMVKSNTALDYDSLWYGLRPEYVLVGPHSFYDDLSLSSFVYFYPKLQELLFIPLSNLHDYSFIIIGNIFILLFLLAAIAQAAKKIWGWGENKSVYLLLAVATVPAIAGIASTAKPDILGIFFIFCGWLWFRCYVSSHRRSDLAFSLLCILLCTGTKITCVLWGGLLFCCIALTVIVERRIRKNEAVKHLSKTDISIVLMGIVFTIGVHLRTVLLTGFPIYPIFVQLQSRMGFQAKFPLLRVPSGAGLDQISGTVNDMNMKEAFLKLYRIWFDPESLPHIIMLWVSSMILCLIVLLLLYYRRSALETKNPVERFFSVIFPIIYFVAMLYLMITIPSPDGNYFIAPILLVSMHIICALTKGNDTLRLHIPKVVLTVLCLSIILTQIPLVMVSHPSWMWGTRGFVPLIRPNQFESTDNNRQILRDNGYGKINRYITANKLDGLILTSNCEMTVIGRISGRVESRQDLEAYCGGLHITEASEYKQFDGFIKIARVQGFLLDKDDESGFAVNCRRYLVNHGYENGIEDVNANLYLLRKD